MATAMENLCLALYSYILKKKKPYIKFTYKPSFSKQPLTFRGFCPRCRFGGYVRRTQHTLV